MNSADAGGLVLLGLRGLQVYDYNGIEFSGGNVSAFQVPFDCRAVAGDIEGDGVGFVGPPIVVAMK